MAPLIVPSLGNTPIYHEKVDTKWTPHNMFNRVPWAGILLNANLHWMKPCLASSNGAIGMNYE